MIATAIASGYLAMTSTATTCTWRWWGLVLAGGALGAIFTGLAGVMFNLVRLQPAQQEQQQQQPNGLAPQVAAGNAGKFFDMCVLHALYDG